MIGISFLHIYQLLMDQGAQCMTYIHNFYKPHQVLFLIVMGLKFYFKHHVMSMKNNYTHMRH